MTPRSLRFESFVLDLERLCLHGPSGQVDLRPKSFEVLRFLAERAGRVVSKEEVMQAVWPDVTVGDESLTQCIRDVRRALSDESQSLVKTVPRRGYLLDAAVLADDAAAAAQPSPSVGTAVVGEVPSIALPDRPSIAVLAFTNMSGDPGQEYLSDGITEDIITELSRFSELAVIARNSSFKYKGQSVDVRQVGRELGVRYMLEGSIRCAGGHIRVSAQLIDAVTGAHHWAERYDRKLEDVFTLQDEVARTIAAMLAIHVNRAEIERLPAKQPTDWQAYDYHLRATDIFSRFQSTRNKQDHDDARSLWRQALAIDPGYAPAHAALSNSYVILWFHRWDDDCPWPDVLDHASECANTAIRLAPNLPEARLELGWTLIWRRQHDAAIAEFERAFALNPNLTSTRFALTLVIAGKPAEAIDYLKRHMRLDPFYEPLAPMTMGAAYYMLERYAEGLPHLQAGVSRAPNMWQGRAWLTATYSRLGRLDDARAQAAELLRILPSYRIRRAPFFLALKQPEDVEHFVEALRKADLPE